MPGCMRRGPFLCGRRGALGALERRLRNRAACLAGNSSGAGVHFESQAPAACVAGWSGVAGAALRELRGPQGGGEGRSSIRSHAPRATLARQPWRIGTLRAAAAEAHEVAFPAGHSCVAGVAHRGPQGSGGGGRHRNGSHAPRATLPSQEWRIKSLRAAAAEADAEPGCMRRGPL